MGCWNGSCFFSGLPILEDEPAVVFPIVLLPEGPSLTWLPIYGKYNDYGSLKDIVETTLTTRLVELVKSDERIELGSQYKYAMRNSAPIMTIDDLMNCMEREACRSDVIGIEIDGAVRGISFVMVHGAIWKTIKANIDTTLSKPDHGELDSMMTPTMLKCMGDDPDLVELVKGRTYRYVQKELGVMGQLTPYTDFMGEALWKGLGYTPGSTDIAEPARSAILDMLTFRVATGRARKTLVLDQHGGSQAQDYDFVKALAEETIKICDANVEQED